MIADPRRTIVMAHSNSSNPRARRWYRIAEACEFDGQLFLHRDHARDVAEHMRDINGACPRTKADATALAKVHAQATGHAHVPGVFSGYFGHVLKRLDTA